MGKININLSNMKLQDIIKQLLDLEKSSNRIKKHLLLK